VISDGAIGRQPHLLELELFDSLLVGRNGRALDTDRVLLDCLGGIKRDLVVGLIKVWVDELDRLAMSSTAHLQLLYLVLDDLPDNPGHLITVKLHDGVLDLDLLDACRRRHPALSNMGIEAWCCGRGAVCACASCAGELGRCRR
jgi:hypothetical protein